MTLYDSSMISPSRLIPNSNTVVLSRIGATYPQEPGSRAEETSLVAQGIVTLAALAAASAALAGDVQSISLDVGEAMELAGNGTVALAAATALKLPPNLSRLKEDRVLEVVSYDKIKASDGADKLTHVVLDASRFAAYSRKIEAAVAPLASAADASAGLREAVVLTSEVSTHAQLLSKVAEDLLAARDLIEAADFSAAVDNIVEQWHSMVAALAAVSSHPKMKVNV